MTFLPPEKWDGLDQWLDHLDQVLQDWHTCKQEHGLQEET